MYRRLKMNTDEEKAVYGSVDTNEDEDVMDAEDIEEARDSFADSFDFESHGREILRENRKAYSWRKFLPSLNPVEFARWLVTGFSKESELEEEEMEDNTIKLARMISLLREYNERFGIPSRGGAREQLWVLTELCCKLYASGKRMRQLNKFYILSEDISLIPFYSVFHLKKELLCGSSSLSCQKLQKVSLEIERLTLFYLQELPSSIRHPTLRRHPFQWNVDLIFARLHLQVRTNYFPFPDYRQDLIH